MARNHNRTCSLQWVALSRGDTRTPGEIAEIHQHLGGLKQQPWLLPAQRWWPDFLFHCTDVRNIVNILRTGEMLSRTQALASRQLLVDIASPEIIAQTEGTWQDYVRLYFRPRTPTQYQNEGFRPIGQQVYHAQCPVPVYLLIDAMAVLSRADVLFTNGNVAAGAMPTDGIESLRAIPFETVYHDTRFDPPDRATIIYHRNAEVLLPERLSTTAIRFICCRSQAEYETLRNLLPPGILNRWAARTSVRPDLNLFHKRWCFVEQVEMTPESVMFRFNVGNPPGPFKAHAEVVEFSTGKLHTWQNDEVILSETLRLRLNFQHPQDYTIQFFLDDQLSYSGRYQEEPLPF